MASKGGVIVVVSGEDKTGEVFNAIKKHMDETKSTAKETSDSLGHIGESLKQGLAAAGIAIGFKELIGQLHAAITEAAEFGESIAKAGQRTGVAAGTLSVLHYAAAVTSTDFDKLVMASGKMGKNLADAADGNKKLDSAFQKIGVTARDIVNRHDALDIVLQHLGKTLAETESPARRLQIAGDLLGKSGQAQIPVLIDLAEHFDDLKKKAQSAGVYLDDMSANQLQELNAKMKDLEQRVLGAKVSFAEGLTPALNGIIAEFSTASGGTDIWTSAGRQAGLVAIEVAAAFKWLADFVRESVDEFTNLTSAINAFDYGIGSKFNWTQKYRDEEAARRDASLKAMHDSKMDHDAMLSEETKFVQDMKGIEQGLLHPSPTATPNTSTPPPGTPPPPGGGGGGRGGGKGKKESEPFTVDTEALDEQDLIDKANMERAVAALNKADADAAAAWDKVVTDAQASQLATITELFKNHTKVMLAPQEADHSAIEGEAEKFAHGLFDPLFNLGEKWNQQWKQIRANMLKDLGEAAESQLFGALFGDPSGRGGKGWDGSRSDASHKGISGPGGAVGEGLSALEGLFHRKSSSVSNGTGNAGAGTVLSSVAGALQVGKGAGSGTGGVQVILNNMGTPATVDSTQQSGGSAEAMILQVVLKDQQTNGAITQGFSSLFSH